MPKFSIITVCLNEPRLERTCESIVNQTYQDFEWIVIDGGSKPETLAIFEKYKSRMNYFVSEPDGGIYFGMNKGIAQATGEWLNFMNAGDCFCANDVLAKVAEDTGKCADYDILYGEVIIDNADKDVFITHKGMGEVNKLYFVCDTIHHSAVFLRQALFAKYGYYRTDIQIVSDYEFFLRIYMASHKFKALDYIIDYYDNRGLSSLPANRASLLHEREKILCEYHFTDEEIALGKEQAKRRRIQALRERHTL